MDESTLNIRDVIKILKKRTGLILGLLFAFTVTTLVVNMLIPPTYEATTTMRVRQQKGLANSLLGESSSAASAQTMATYGEILQSRTVMVQLQEELEKNKNGKFTGIVGKITVAPVKNTELMSVKVQSGTPEEAKWQANTLINVFLDRLTSLTRQQQASIREFIGQRTLEAKKDLEKTEDTLEKYRITQKIYAPSDDIKAVVEKISAMDKMSAENRISMEVAQAKIASAQQQMGNQKISIMADNALIQQYKNKISEKEIELVGLTETVTDNHPKVIAAKAVISETRSKLNEEIARVVSADSSSSNPIHQILLRSRIEAEIDIDLAKAREQALQKVISDSEKHLANLPAKELGLVRVMREASVAQEIYIMLAKRYEEARINEVMEPTDVQVVDAAYAPAKPVAPRVGINTAIAGLLGLFVGIGLAFGLEFINRTIRTADDVEQYLGLPVLGTIPVHGSEAKPPNSFITKITGLFQEQQHRRHQRRS